MSRPRPRTCRGFTLIELLVVIAIIGILVGLLLPAVQAAREAARRVQCTNNLKQIALAALSYEASHGCYPGGSYSARSHNPPSVAGQPENFSCFVRMLPFFEQSAMYDATNFQLCSSDPANLTICGVQVGALLCPSDTENNPVVIQLPAAVGTPGAPGYSFNTYALPPGIWMQTFSSYAGNAGTYDFGFNKTFLNQASGKAEFAQYNGVIYNDSSVKIADVRDGTSSTFLFGEHSHSQLLKFDPAYGVSDNSWNSGRWYDTLFATYYPLNIKPGAPGATGAGLFGDEANYWYPTVATSLHPGGANFAFCDGSVRFLKDGVSSWTFSPAGRSNHGWTPVGVTWKSFVFTVHPGAQLGVYQKLGCGK